MPSHEAQGFAVQVVAEAVQDAVAQAIEETVRFDLRANFYTLIAITGVILYWRGIWTLWDYCFGMRLESELASIAIGLIVMVSFRLSGVSLLESLPGG